MYISVHQALYLNMVITCIDGIIPGEISSHSSDDDTTKKPVSPKKADSGSASSGFDTDDSEFNDG